MAGRDGAERATRTPATRVFSYLVPDHFLALSLVRGSLPCATYCLPPRSWPLSDHGHRERLERELDSAGSSAGVRSPSAWVVARYGRGGGLDRSFGHGGLVVSDFSTGADWVGGLAQRDGRIVAAGSVGESQALARYRAG